MASENRRIPWHRENFVASTGETQPQRFTWRTTAWSLGGLAAGVAVGSALGSRPGEHTTFTLSILTSLGTLWMNALRMVALPLALGNTICAMVGEKTARAAGRIGGAIAIYLVLLCCWAPRWFWRWSRRFCTAGRSTMPPSPRSARPRRGRLSKAAADTTPLPGPWRCIAGIVAAQLVSIGGQRRLSPRSC